MPKVSVVLPTFNRPVWLAESVNSVLSQDGTDLELLILDNGSGQDTQDYIASLNDPRVRKYRFETNHAQSGGQDPWTFLLERITGEYFILWTDDDRMKPGNIWKKAHFLDNHPECGMVFSPVEEIGSDGFPFGPQRNGWCAEEVNFSTLFRHNQVPMPSAMTRARYSNVWDAGTRFAQWADWAFWLNVSRSSKIGYIPEALVELRLHSNSDTNAAGIRGAEFIQLYPRLWGHWMDSGHKPSAEDWDLMRSVYLFLAHETFETFKRRHNG